MSKGRPLLEHDLPISAGQSAVTIISSGGGSEGNADTVDGFHAAATPQPNSLLALNAASKFPTNVIDLSGLMHNDLGGLTVGNPHTQYVNSASGGIAKTGQDVALAASVAGDGLDLTSGVLSVKTGTGIRIVSDAVAIDGHTHQTAAQGGTLDHGLALTGLADDDHSQYALLLPMLSTRNVIQAGALDVTPLTLKGAASQSASLWQVKDSTGATLIEVNQSGDLQSAGFQSGIRGWRVDHEGTAEFQNAYVRGELHATVFVKDLIEAHAGTLGIFKSGGKLHVDFTIPAIGATATLTVTDPPGGGFLFSSGDWVRIKAEHASGVYDVWGQVTLPVDNSDGTQSYTYTHRSGTVGAVIPAGVAVADYGASGQGYILATADLNYAPYLDVASWAGANPYTGSNHTAHVRLGQLRGITGSSEYGLWAGGTYSGLTGTRYLKASTAGLTIYGLPQTWVNAAGNIRGQVDPTATGSNYLFWLGPSSGDKRFGVDGNGVVYIGSIPSQHVAGWAHGSDTTKIDGGDIYAGSVTAAQMSVTGFNLVDNPGFEYWSSTTAANGWALHADAVRTSSTVRSGTYCLAGPGTGAAKALAQQDIPATAGASYYLEGWVFLTSPASGITRNVRWEAVELDAAGLPGTYHHPTEGDTIPKGVWRRQTCLFTTASNCAKVRVYLYAGADLVAGEYARGDDVSLRAASGMNLLVGTAGSARVEINNEGIEGRDSSNTLQFRIRTSDGVGAFGPSGKESLISEGGLRLYGGESIWTDFSAVRWFTNPEVTTGGRVASIGAGLYYGGTAPMLQMIANPNDDYATGSMTFTARSSTAGKSVSMELRSSPTYGGTWTMSGQHQGYPVAWYLSADYNGFGFTVGGTERLSVTAAKVTTQGRLEAGGVIRSLGALSGAEGGEIQLELAAPYVGTYAFWFIDTYAESLRIGPTGVTRMQITADGNVGISTSPSQRLHVNGVVRADTRFDLGTAMGVSGNFTALTSASLTPASFSFSTTYRNLVTDVTGSGITVSRTGNHDWCVNPGTFSGGSLSTGSGTAGFSGGIRTT